MPFTRSTVLTGYTASENGSSGVFSLEGCAIAALFVSCSSLTGTNPVLAVFLQGSPDDGTTWFDIPANLVCPSLSDSTSHATTVASTRNAIALTGTTGASVAIYRDVAFKHGRLRWVLAGTTPEAIFSATVDVK